MSFFPVSSSNPSSNPLLRFNDSFFGAIDLTKFDDLTNLDNFGKINDRSLIDRDIHESLKYKKSKYRTLIVIIISAIMFITIISIYDVVRNYVTIYYADVTLEDPLSMNTEEDINKTEFVNHNKLKASLIFSLICIISAIILIPLLSNYI